MIWIHSAWRPTNGGRVSFHKRIKINFQISSTAHCLATHLLLYSKAWLSIGTNHFPCLVKSWRVSLNAQEQPCWPIRPKQVEKIQKVEKCLHCCAIDRSNIQAFLQAPESSHTSPYAPPKRRCLVLLQRTTWFGWKGALSNTSFLMLDQLFACYPATAAGTVIARAQGQKQGPAVVAKL